MSNNEASLLITSIFVEKMENLMVKDNHINGEKKDIEKFSKNLLLKRVGEQEPLKNWNDAVVKFVKKRVKSMIESDEFEERSRNATISIHQPGVSPKGLVTFKTIKEYKYPRPSNFVDASNHFDIFLNKNRDTKKSKKIKRSIAGDDFRCIKFPEENFTKEKTQKENNVSIKKSETIQKEESIDPDETIAREEWKTHFDQWEKDLETKIDARVKGVEDKYKEIINDHKRTILGLKKSCKELLSKREKEHQEIMKKLKKEYETKEKKIKLDFQKKISTLTKTSLEEKNKITEWKEILKKQKVKNKNSKREVKAVQEKFKKVKEELEEKENIISKLQEESTIERNRISEERKRKNKIIKNLKTEIIELKDALQKKENEEKEFKEKKRKFKEEIKEFETKYSELYKYDGMFKMFQENEGRKRKQPNQIKIDYSNLFKN